MVNFLSLCQQSYLSHDHFLNVLTIFWHLYLFNWWNWSSSEQNATHRVSHFHKNMLSPISWTLIDSFFTKSHQIKLFQQFDSQSFLILSTVSFSLFEWQLFEEFPLKLWILLAPNILNISYFRCQWWPLFLTFPLCQRCNFAFELRSFWKLPDIIFPKRILHSWKTELTPHQFFFALIYIRLLSLRILFLFVFLIMDHFSLFLLGLCSVTFVTMIGIFLNHLIFDLSL